MAHEIDTSTGRAAFVFEDGRPAWHGLGRVIPEHAARDPAQIAALACADYRVDLLPVGYYIDGQWQPVTDRAAVVRLDTGAPLGIVSDHYRVVQPIEYFAAYAEALEAEKLTISSAAVLKGGKIVFVTARVPNAGFLIGKTDTIDVYLCIGGGYDGERASFLYVSTLRAVCRNTLTIAARNAANNGRAVTWPHRQTVTRDTIARAIDAALTGAAATKGELERLANKPIDTSGAREYFARVIGVGGKKEDDLTAQQVRKLRELLAAYNSAPGAQPGTMYGALQAVTYYADHVATVRAGNGDQHAARVYSVQFGSGAALKARAYELALAA